MNNKVILKIITSNDEDINIPFMRLQELDDYTIISIKDKTKIKQKDLFDLLKICKIDFHMQN